MPFKLVATFRLRRRHYKQGHLNHKIPVTIQQVVKTTTNKSIDYVANAPTWDGNEWKIPSAIFRLGRAKAAGICSAK